ncbi:MAG: hypothetical protein GC196_15830 [Hyphomonas sp.]|nr:hypothetical protein [Hyphomonas sp.]
MKPGWRYAKAAVTGTRHAADGRGCEDFAVARIIGSARGNVLAACVCDGAGSSPQAATGARVAAEAFLTVAGDRLRDAGGLVDERDLADFLSFAGLAVTLKAFTEKNPARDYATTLMGALVSESWSAFVQVGDGAMVVPSAPGRWELVFEPQRGTYANETYFLTDDDARLRAHVAVRPYGVAEVALFSDGLERLLIREAAGSPVAEAFFNEMLPAVRGSGAPGEDLALAQALSAYLSSEAINARTDDDKSLILASRLLPAQPSPEGAAATDEHSHAASG